MPLYELIEEMKVLNEKDIVLVRTGAFFIATDLDAYILYELFGFKVVKYGKNRHKVGIPVNSLKKYINKLNEMKVPFCIYDTLENSLDPIYLDSIVSRNFVINRKFEFKSNEYDYVKIYDNNENDGNNLCHLENKDIDIASINKLFEIERKRRNISNVIYKFKYEYLKDGGISEK